MWGTTNIEKFKGIRMTRSPPVRTKTPTIRRFLNDIMWSINITDARPKPSINY